MQSKTAIVVSVSVGTGLLLFFSVCVLAASVIAIHNESVDKKQPSIVPSAPVIPRAGATGDSETKEQQLNRELGPVNRSKLLENKTGLFSRIEAARQARSSSCSSITRPRVVPKIQLVRRTPVQSSSCCGTQFVTHLQSVQSTCTSSLSYSTQIYAPQPTPIAPKYREIDPSTCKDGSCALKNASSTGEFPDLFKTVPADSPRESTSIPELPTFPRLFD